MRVLVWLSGWVDSAVTAYLLKEQGYEVVAGFMVNYRDPENPECQTRIDKAEAKRVAEYLGIEFRVYDFVDIYEEKVLNYMYEWYQKWITPNPDIMCNSEVKFKVFLEEAMKDWFDKIATGHYARIKDWQGELSWKDKRGCPGVKLLKWVDNNKDQSYFLAGLSKEQLSKALFPIGELEKPEVRKIARKAGLPNAERKDSQWICFVWKVNMADFLEKKIKPKKWIVKDTSGNILWEHNWVFYYTIGQRKWLDIWGQSEAIFVVKKNLEKNEIIVWTSSDLELYSDKLIIKNINNLSSWQWWKAKCKIRYRQADQDCFVTKITKDEYQVKFEEKQRAITSGQICAIYLWDELVMSGIIN